ncbi:Meiotically up-regulated protein 86 protein [Savitreella phatthalungensis]
MASTHAAAPIAGNTTAPAGTYTTNATQYNSNNTGSINTAGLDLERLQTISTILGPNAGTLAVEPHKRFRDFGNPSPLGLSAFALTTMVLSLINVHARHVTTPNIVIGIALFYGGLCQLLAGMWEFAVGNTFGATALSSYGGFWMSFACIFIPFFNIESAYENTTTFGDALGFYLLCWGIFTFLLLLCTLKSTVMFFSLFFTLFLAFLMLAIGYFRMGDTHSTELLKAGGYFGIMAAAIAWYNALAGIVETHNSFFAVPTMPFPWSEAGRVGRSRSAAARSDKSS